MHQRNPTRRFAPARYDAKGQGGSASTGPGVFRPGAGCLFGFEAPRQWGQGAAPRPIAIPGGLVARHREDSTQRRGVGEYPSQTPPGKRSSRSRNVLRDPEDDPNPEFSARPAESARHPPRLIGGGARPAPRQCALRQHYRRRKVRRVRRLPCARRAINNQQMTPLDSPFLRTALLGAATGLRTTVGLASVVTSRTDGLGGILGHPAALPP